MARALGWTGPCDGRGRGLPWTLAVLGMVSAGLHIGWTFYGWACSGLGIDLAGHVLVFSVYGQVICWAGAERGLGMGMGVTWASE
jgi:hypothetical protein